MNRSTIRPRKKSKSIRKQMKIDTQQPKPMGHSKHNDEGQFTAIQAYLKKIEKSQINNQTLHLQELEEHQQTAPSK